MDRKISKFLICSNPMVSEDQYILCTRDPQVLIKVIQNGKEIELDVMEVYSGTQEDIEGALKRAKDWYMSQKAFTNKRNGLHLSHMVIDEFITKKEEQ